MDHGFNTLLGRESLLLILKGPFLLLITNFQSDIMLPSKNLALEGLGIGKQPLFGDRS